MDFSEIYRRYVRDVQRFSLYLSGNRVLAEDLTAETFVHAFCGPSVLRADTVKAYLFTIARNLYRDEIARCRRLAPMDDAAEPVDPAPSQDQSAADRQKLSRVLQALQRLPETQREALALAVGQDLRYEQVAAILGCSVMAVKVRIHRARLQLKLELDAEEKSWKT